MSAPAKLTPSQAAKLMHVTPDTLRRWADEGLLSVDRTLGGHRRYDLEELRRVASDRYGFVSGLTSEDDRP